MFFYFIIFISTLFFNLHIQSNRIKFVRLVGVKQFVVAGGMKGKLSVSFAG